MKNILPIISLIGASTLLVGCSNTMQIKKEAFIGNLNEFQEDLKEYTSLNDKNLTRTAFNKYNLTVVSNNIETLTENAENNVSSLNQAHNSTNIDYSINQSNKPEIDNEIEINSGTETNQFKSNEILQNKTELNKNETTQTNIDEIKSEDLNQNNEILNKTDSSSTSTEQISTLYSLSEDISNSCDDFCELKKSLTSAIVETQNLIDKVNSKEIELTNEQKMFITEQSMELKNLGRKLSNITTELAFHLSDLNGLSLTNSESMDTLNMKYLIVLDNLVNGNEMLQSSLSSLNLINQMFNAGETLPPNNYGRILYGFQHNNQAPIIKDYYISQDGNLIENQQTNQQENKTNEDNKENNDADDVEKNNIDSYQSRALNTNIDTYQNNNTPHNIDTFFNTALLDNEFMYGNGRFNNNMMGNMYGGANPYLYNYSNYERNNSQYSVDNNQATQNIDENQQDMSKEKRKEQKKRKFKKNIDTYKDENEPDIKTKLASIKNSISGFFSKFKGADLDDKIDNPIYRYETNNN